MKMDTSLIPASLSLTFVCKNKNRSTSLSLLHNPCLKVNRDRYYFNVINRKYHYCFPSMINGVFPFPITITFAFWLNASSFIALICSYCNC